MINALFLLFSFLFNLVFLISNFDVRYDGAYLSCAYVPCTVKFTTFIDELVGKNKSVFSKPMVVRSYLKLQKNYHLIDQKMFFCNSRFNFHLDIYKVFKETVSFSFAY